MHKVKPATVGSCVICYANDPSIINHATKTLGAPVIALIQRSDGGLGVLGGYTNLGKDTTKGEQPKNGAVRELKEEAINDIGKAVISPQPERLQLIANGIDYRKPALPVVWHAHAMELKAEELKALKEHAERMKRDEAYKQAVKKKSRNEIDGMLIMPLAEVIALPRESFTHPHEFDAITELAKQLKQPKIFRTR